METRYFFDLDGTLTSVELLPLIAKEVGLEAEMAELTASTMAGDIPFEESFRMRVGWLSEVPVGLISDIVLTAPVHTKLLEWVVDRRDQCMVVTGNLDCWVSPWLDYYGLRGVSSTAFVENGHVGVQEILEKQRVLSDFGNFRTVFVGDGANDAQAMAQADIGIANAIVHSVPNVVLEVADCVALEEDVLCQTLSQL